MAVGDVVSGISAANAILTFQPASGVEVVITWIGGMTSGTPNYAKLTDGTLETHLKAAQTGSSDNMGNIKMFLTNTYYLKINALGAGEQSGYTGVQIK